MSAGMVFIDTTAFIAMTVETDSLHLDAMRVMEEIAGNRVLTVTSDLVLVELLNGSSNTARRAVAASFVRGVLDNQTIGVVPMDHDSFVEALSLYQSRPDKRWSLVDCASMIICQRMKIGRVFTHDHHFRQAGFEILL